MLYIYIYIEREREGEEAQLHTCIDLSLRPPKREVCEPTAYNCPRFPLSKSMYYCLGQRSATYL